MKFSVSSVCRKGGRKYNQDAYSVYSASESPAFCAAVCDGLGSYHGSEIVSAAAADFITGAFKTAYDEKGSAAFSRVNILKMFSDTQSALSDMKQKNYALHASCTTIAAMFSDLDTITFAHIGDSRIYLFRQGRLVYRTVDHSMAQIAVEQGLITPAEIRSHPDQNKLTRVLGSEYYTDPDITYVDQPFAAGDAVIICTDGFWEYVYEEEMEVALKTFDMTKLALKALEGKLIQRAPEHNDNYTAILLKAVK